MIEGNELPTGWANATAADVVEILDSQRIPVNSEERAERLAAAKKTYPYYGATGQVGEIDDYIFDGETVLLGEDGAPFLEPYRRKAFRVSGKYWVNNHAHILRTNGAIDHGYLCHQLNTLNYRPYVSGTTRLKLTQAKLKELPLRIAPLPEQQRIVEKIDTLFVELDKGEEALREVQKLLARYRRSVLKAAVTGELIGKGSADWTPVVLGNLLEDIRYGTAKKCWPGGEGTAVLRIPNVVGSEINLTDLKFTSLTKNEFEKLSLREGDILIVRSNGSANLVGRGAIVTSEAVGMAYAGYLIRLRLDRERISPAFLHLVLNSPAIRARIERQAKSTSGVHNLNSAEVKAIAFDLPDLETQTAVVEAVEEALARIAQGEAWCEAELKRSAALRQSILKEAFSGKLVPQDPSDESANRLLERIRAGKRTEHTKTPKLQEALA